ncbi:hypothetical protein FGO68_gene3217 [Halteria grandinella]|uniref:Uncharacterized protein n=1 Tax=Halteria grandinella TaxID=5974 RepID=A0A8J8NWD0_HALGN|nr:hypothetical protein FGO68_gene3217 [Halteria grandinella]
MQAAVKNMNKTIGQERFKITGAYEYQTQIEQSIMNKVHYALYSSDKKMFMAEKESRLRLDPPFEPAGHFISQEESLNFQIDLGNNVRMQGIQQGEKGTALDEFLLKAINLQSFQIIMNKREITPLQAKLQIEKPFPTSLSTLILGNPCAWNISLYIDIINKSKGQISKLILKIRDPNFDASLLLEKVDPNPLRELDVTFDYYSDFITQHFFDCIDNLSTNLETLTIHIDGMYPRLEQIKLFRDNMESILPKLSYLHTLKFKPFLNQPHQGQADISFPPCLFLGQPPHLTSLVLFCEIPPLGYSIRLKDFLSELNEKRTSRLRVIIDYHDPWRQYRISFDQFKQLQTKFPMIELDIGIHSDTLK